VSRTETRPVRQRQHFGDMLLGAGIIRRPCAVDGCDERVGADELYCVQHRCTLVDGQGVRCSGLAAEGGVCEGHASADCEALVLDPGSPLPRPKVVEDPPPVAAAVESEGDSALALVGEGVLVRGEFEAPAAGSDTGVPSSPAPRSPKLGRARRVRKTWELPASGLEELAGFAHRLEEAIGVRVSEAQHISIAIQVYSDFLKASPTLLSRIDDAIVGTETIVQAQDVVTRTMRQHIAELLAPGP
jgi:hypothetical protein